MQSIGLRPHVLIVGGFLTEPLMYRPMRDRLLARGAASVHIAPLHLPDWLAMGLGGLRPAALRTALAIRRARRTSGAPLLVVGHSAGGILARLAMCSEPFDGRRLGLARDVACLVTLGSPHALHEMPLLWRHPGVQATAFLARSSAGACFAPGTGYLTVGSRYVPAGRHTPTNAMKRATNLAMRTLVGRTPGAPGDGIVGDHLCRLDDARHLALPDVLHGVFGGPWYGDARVIDRWWPVALEEWHAALEWRSGGPARSVRRPVPDRSVRRPAGSSPAARSARSR